MLIHAFSILMDRTVGQFVANRSILRAFDFMVRAIGQLAAIHAILRRFVFMDRTIVRVEVNNSILKRFVFNLYVIPNGFEPLIVRLSGK